MKRSGSRSSPLTCSMKSGNSPRKVSSKSRRKLRCSVCQLLRTQSDERLLGILGFEQFDDPHAVGVETLDVGAAKLHVLAHILRFDLVGVVELVVGPHQRAVGGVEPMVDVGQLAIDLEIAVIEASISRLRRRV